jgi:imidazoleglycerol phosphate synthase glutamine amidotransferase subunit HisH
MPTVHLLDYVAGNVRSLVNAIEKVGYEVEWVRSPEDVAKAEVRTTTNNLAAAGCAGELT